MGLEPAGSDENPIPQEVREPSTPLFPRINKALDRIENVVQKQEARGDLNYRTRRSEYEQEQLARTRGFLKDVSANEEPIAYYLSEHIDGDIRDKGYLADLCSAWFEARGINMPDETVKIMGTVSEEERWVRGNPPEYHAYLRLRDMMDSYKRSKMDYETEIGVSPMHALGETIRLARKAMGEDTHDPSIPITLHEARELLKGITGGWDMEKYIPETYVNIDGNDDNQLSSLTDSAIAQKRDIDNATLDRYERQMMLAEADRIAGGVIKSALRAGNPDSIAFAHKLASQGLAEDAIAQNISKFPYVVEGNDVKTHANLLLGREVVSMFKHDERAGYELIQNISGAPSEVQKGLLDLEEQVAGESVHARWCDSSIVGSLNNLDRSVGIEIAYRILKRATSGRYSSQSYLLSGREIGMTKKIIDYLSREDPQNFSSMSADVNSKMDIIARTKAGFDLAEAREKARRDNQRYVIHAPLKKR